MAVMGAENQLLRIFPFELQFAGVSEAWARKTTAGRPPCRGRQSRHAVLYLAESGSTPVIPIRCHNRLFSQPRLKSYSKRKTTRSRPRCSWLRCASSPRSRNKMAQGRRFGSTREMRMRRNRTRTTNPPPLYLSHKRSIVAEEQGNCWRGVSYPG